MGVMSTIKSYRALSKDQKAFLKKKVLDGDRTPAEWLGLLRGVAEFDIESDKARTRLNWMLGISIALLIGSFFFPPLLIVTIPLLVLVVIAKMWNSRVDVIHLRECVVPLLALLEDDLKRGRTMRLRLDLRGATSKEKLVEKRTPTPPPGVRKLVEAIYTDPWLEGEAVLSDGARLRLSITDQVRELTRTKRSSSGKTKTKTKYKIKELLELQLKLPVASYRASADRFPAGGRSVSIQVVSGDKWHSLSAKRILERTDVKQATTMKPVIELLTRLYSGAERIAEEVPTHA